MDTVSTLGASYGDMRIVFTTEESVRVKNGRVEVMDRSEDRGFGIRVIADGGWGFAASADLSKKEIEGVAALAVRVAKSSAQLKRKEAVLAPSEKMVATYETPIEIDPFTVSWEDKVELLLGVEELIRKVKGVKISNASMRFISKEQIFANTEGSFIEQKIVESGAGIDATAIKDGETQTRSYPMPHYGHFKTCGYELIEQLKLSEHAQRVGEEAVALLSARACPEGQSTVILDGTCVALQVHETCGHPTELDRVLGTEVSLAGTSFLTTDKLNSFKYGSPIVSITADATVPGGLGTFGYDDEGVPAQRSYLVKDGVFAGYLTSRETATVLGGKSNGTMRADGWQNIPLVRMTNINLEPGEWKLEDMIADTEDGVYLETWKSVSIDDKRLNFHGTAEIGWEIKGGKRAGMLKNPTYTGITYEIWNSCDAIGKKDHWVVWGVPGCGKGDPMQIAHVGHGTSPARFRNMRVGAGR